MKIDLNEEDILDDAEHLSAYIGSKDSARPELYPVVAATKSDRPLLMKFLSESLADLLSEVKHIVRDVVKDGGRILILFAVMRAVPVGAVRTLIRSYLVNRVLGRWLAIVSPDRAAVYDREATERVDLLRGLLAAAPSKGRRTEPL